LAQRFGFSPNERGSLKGLPLEYAVYAHLQAHLASRGGVAVMGGHLEPLKDDADLDNQHTEVDGLALYRGALWFVECKLDARALVEQAPIMESLVDSVGGSHAKGLMVARSWKGSSPPQGRNLVYMAFEAGEGVLRFPQDLDKALDEALGLAGL
jgi:hypothetical protein